MKTSTSLDHGIRFGMRPEESAQLLRDAGFDGIDLSLCVEPEEKEKLLTEEWRRGVREQTRAARAAGLEICQCHLPYYPGHYALPGSGSYEEFEDFMLPGYRASLELCGEVGCPIAVMHPFFVTGDPETTVEGNQRMIAKLAPLLEKTGVRLALENVYGVAYAPSHMTCGEELMRVLEKTDPALAGACIDTGHANIFKVHVGNMARVLGSRLIALHVNGNCGQDEHLIPYSSSGWCELMDFHDFSAALKEIGYAGSYNLEINPGDMPPAVISSYVRFAAAMARELSNEAEG